MVGIWLWAVSGQGLTGREGNRKERKLWKAAMSYLTPEF